MEKCVVLPPPECAKTPGLDIIAYDLDAHTVELTFDGKREFANPIGIVQGGFLSAMLDDTMGLASATAMNVGEFAPTLGLNVQFHRPAKIGKLTGKGRITMQAREHEIICAPEAGVEIPAQRLVTHTPGPEGV